MKLRAAVTGALLDRGFLWRKGANVHTLCRG